jgi:hypothetical protein
MTLKGLVDTAKSNPAMVQTVLEQVKAALGM